MTHLGQVKSRDDDIPGTGEMRVGCSTERYAACFAPLNTTFAEAANVANERMVIPDFDDDRLDAICR